MKSGSSISHDFQQSKITKNGEKPKKTYRALDELDLQMQQKKLLLPGTGKEDNAKDKLSEDRWEIWSVLYIPKVLKIYNLFFFYTSTLITSAETDNDPANWESNIYI